MIISYQLKNFLFEKLFAASLSNVMIFINNNPPFADGCQSRRIFRILFTIYARNLSVIELLVRKALSCFVEKSCKCHIQIPLFSLFCLWYNTLFTFSFFTKFGLTAGFRSFGRACKYSHVITSLSENGDYRSILLA